MPPGSEVANLTVLGYDAHQCYQGRGVIEAASMGVKLNDEDIAMRCNLICIADGRIKNHSAGHISTPEAHKLIRYVDRYVGGDDAHFFPGISYRHLFILDRGSTDFECFPPHDHVGEKVEDLMIVAKSDAAKPTVDRLNDMIRCSWDLLPQHSVNQARIKERQGSGQLHLVLVPGPEAADEDPEESEYGITGAVISAVDLIKGLGVYAGLDVIDVPGATGLIDTNYEGKADACLAALADHDFVFVHVEATDEAGHSRDVKQKIQGIEYLDSRLVARVMKGIEDMATGPRSSVLGPVTWRCCPTTLPRSRKATTSTARFRLPSLPPALRPTRSRPTTKPPAPPASSACCGATNSFVPSSASNEYSPLGKFEGQSLGAPPSDVPGAPWERAARYSSRFPCPSLDHGIT